MSARGRSRKVGTRECRYNCKSAVFRLSDDYNAERWMFNRFHDDETNFLFVPVRERAIRQGDEKRSYFSIPVSRVVKKGRVYNKKRRDAADLFGAGGMHPLCRRMGISSGRRTKSQVKMGPESCGGEKSA